MLVDNKYNIGETVYLKTDTDQEPRIVTCIKAYPDGLIYQLSCGIQNTDHYDFEISKEKDLVE